MSTKRTLTPENFVSSRTRSNSTIIQHTINPLLNAPKKAKILTGERDRIVENQDNEKTPSKSNE